MTSSIKTVATIIRQIIHLSEKPPSIPSTEAIIQNLGTHTEDQSKTRVLSPNVRSDLTPLSIPLGDKKVYIKSNRLQGSWKDKLCSLPLSSQLELRLWGRYGKKVLNELENELKFHFDDETRTFIQEIGNLDIESESIIIGGNSEKTSNCITATKDVDLLDIKEELKGVKIMDNAGLSYILYKDGSIQAFEHDYIHPEGVINSFDSIYDLIETSVRRQALG